MKILLSAYACRPNHGSEPAVGWNWTMETARLGHDVYVLTRKDNREFIETETVSENVHFLYYDLPKIFLKAKKFLGIYFYYTLWQAGAYLMLKNKFSEPFDIVHHITYVSFRFPVFLHKLKGKFILGPIAGGEEATPNLTSSLPFRYKALEKMRTGINFLNTYNFFINNAYARSHKIFVTTSETFSKIPVKYHHKTKIAPAIGITYTDYAEVEKHTSFTVLYAGQLLHWKGVHIAIESFAKALKNNPTLNFRIIGSGKFKKELLLLIDTLGIGDKITFIEKLPQQELYNEYKKAHIFLFSSLHDSGGFVVIEAMAHGLPVICLDKGGPPYFVGKDSKNVIATRDKNLGRITDEIASLIHTYATDIEHLKQESADAKLRSQQFQWANIVAAVYDKI